MIGCRPSGPGDGREPDVLGPYLELLRARLTGERFELLIRAVETTCTLLGDGPGPVLEVPADSRLAPALQREYLSLIVVMITGHLDHHLVEVLSPDGDRGWAVVEGARDRRARAAERAWIDAELHGIAGAGGSAAS
ncbi:hypothetical protein AB0P12_22345 [Streptomyces subrutilus]|uniref:hypothetical protein n=1 Tax=Streptomyces subrutilus TaxID=36818 RepID=UPI00342A50CE